MAMGDFKLIVITDQIMFGDECRWIERLLESGVTTLHIRKPDSDLVAVERMLNSISSEFYGKLALHDHFELAGLYKLGGIHLNGRNPAPLEGFKGRISRSCHTLEEVELAKEYCSYVTLSPIFNSISKSGYSSKFSEESLKSAGERGVIDEKVVALGGVSMENIGRVAEYGFGGAALLGAVWSQNSVETAVALVRRLCAEVKCRGRIER